MIEEKVRLLVANVGDSRAIVGKVNDAKHADQLNTEYTATRVTSDHKLTREDEAARIGNVVGGIIVERPSGKRVIPTGISEAIIIKKKLALNMSRALGHNILGQCGVIPVPEFHNVEVDEGDLLVFWRWNYTNIQ